MIYNLYGADFLGMTPVECLVSCVVKQMLRKETTDALFVTPEDWETLVGSLVGTARPGWTIDSNDPRGASVVWSVAGRTVRVYSRVRDDGGRIAEFEKEQPNATE